MSPERETRGDGQQSAHAATDDASLTPDVVKETFSNWEASTAAAKGAAATDEIEAANGARAGDEATTRTASGAVGNFGDTPGLNEGGARRASARESASPTGAERELETPRVEQAHDDAARVETTPTSSAPAVAGAPASDASTYGASTYGASPDGELAKGRESLPGKGRRRTVAVVEESLRPRVEKLRDVSVGMLDDASEDSGLRFVIIAVAMFLLFLVFLFISNFLK